MKLHLNVLLITYPCVVAGSGAPGTPGPTGQPAAGEGGSNVVRKRQKTSSDPESDASESEWYPQGNQCGSYLLESKALSSSFSVHVNFWDFIEFLGWTDMLPTESHRTLSNFMLHKPV